MRLPLILGVHTILLLGERGLRANLKAATKGRGNFAVEPAPSS